MTQAAFVGILKENKILLVQSLTIPRYKSHWSFPGGLVDPGEIPEQAAIREAVEEVGIHCSLERLIAQVINTEDNLAVSIFLGRYVSGELNLQLDEIADARWFTVTEALKLPLAYDIEKQLLQLL